MNEIITIHGVGCYEKNGTAYLKLEAVARGLGFTQQKNGVEYVKWERVSDYLKDFGFSPQVGKDTYIPENIFYRLAMKAKNNAAEAFQAKVADEIIPSIRKHGLYATDNTVDAILADPDFGIRLLTQYKEEREARLKAEKQRDLLMHVQKTYTSTEIAKEMGMKSARVLNKWLQDIGVQFVQNGTWVLYSKYAELGYTEIKQSVLDNGRIVYDRRWTNEGREFLLGLAKGA